MKRLIRNIRVRFSRRARLGKWAFLWRSWAEATVLAYLVGNAIQLLSPAPPRADLAGLGAVHLLILVTVVGPLFETVAFQCLPLELTAILRLRRSVRWCVSIVPFALMHSFAGLPTVVAAGAIGGFYFAFTYERWRRESFFAALLMTFLLHSSFNLVGALAMILLR